MQDPDGDDVLCRWAEGYECAGICNAFPNATLNKVTSVHRLCLRCHYILSHSMTLNITYLHETYVAVTGYYSTVSGLIRLVISLECFIEITPDFLCPFMND